MKIRVELMKENEEADKQKSLNVGLHVRRGDTFVVEQARSIGEGDVLVVEMASNGQIVLGGPDNTSNIVYDRSTMANSVKTPDANTRFVDEGSKIAERPKAEPTMKAGPMATEPGGTQKANEPIPTGTPNAPTPEKPVPEPANLDGSATGNQRVLRG